MKNVKINGADRLVFVVKDGEAASIVIPIDILAPIDYQRLSVLEAKGGELMRVMRDEKLSNGMNCLTQYQHLLIVVPKEAGKLAVSATPEVLKEETTTVKVAKKRGPKPKVKPEVSSAVSSSTAVNPQ